MWSGKFRTAYMSKHNVHIRKASFTILQTFTRYLLVKTSGLQSKVGGPEGFTFFPPPPDSFTWQNQMEIFKYVFHSQSFIIPRKAKIYKDLP